MNNNGYCSAVAINVNFYTSCCGGCCVRMRRNGISTYITIVNHSRTNKFNFSSALYGACAVSRINTTNYNTSNGTASTIFQC